MTKLLLTIGIFLTLTAYNYVPAAEPVNREDIVFEGQLLAVKEAVVRSRISSKVVKISVQEGDNVKKGHILGEIDDERAEQGLKLAEAGRERRKLEYEKALTDFEKVKTSVEKRSASTEDLKNAERGLKISELALKEAEIMLDTARKDYESTILRSPIEGNVTVILKRAGDKVFQDDELVRVVDLHELSLVGNLESRYYGKIKTGIEITFNADYIKDTFKTRIDKIVPYSENGKEFKISAIVQNGSLRLLPGTKVKCMIRLR